MHRLTRKYSIIAAVTSIVTSPVPGVDELFVVPIQYYFTAKVARARDVRLREMPWTQVHTIILGGAAVRFATDLAFGLVPIAGALTHALTAKVLTDFLGQYLDEALKRPESPPPVSIRTLKELIRQSVKRATVRTSPSV